MSEDVQLKVAKAYPNDSGRGIARIDPDTLLKLHLSPGDIVEIAGKEVTAAKVWRADRQDWHEGTIRIDGFTRQNAGVGIGERVTVRKARVNEAMKVVLAPPEGVLYQLFGEMSESIKRQLLKRPVVQGDIVPIASAASHPLMRVPGQAMPLFVVSTVPQEVVLITERTLLDIRDKPVKGFESVKGTGITYEDIGGLSDEIQRIREMIELPMKHPEVFQTLGITPPSGVLLHGPPGTGKTLIAKAVANESGASFYSIAGPEIMSKYYGESEQRLREIFDEAREHTPSIVFIDELDSIAPRREDVTGEVERRVVAQLLTIMDGLEERGQIIVVGATNRVEAIDPALRRPGRFDREIEISVPDYAGRREILEIHTRDMPLSEEVSIEELASITHGFVGADVLSLTKEAAMRALRRYMPDIDLEKEIPGALLNTMRITAEDFKDALREIQPSALREIMVEIPDTTWEDVGGLDEARQEIIEAIEWPIKKPESFSRMGIRPPRGILLFGPPGTGKTLIVKAVANETEANFITVRGPEMISKWVGESERAIRNTFKKARQVAPVVVFLDEIDAIAPMRGIEDTSRVSERVVNTLLTELDGLQDLEGIVVIAATNRPDMIDPALLRSGRFDRMVLIGAPSRPGRVEIYNVHTRTMPLADDVDIEELADLTDWYVGSDIESLCREAAVFALREDFESGFVEMRHFREALKKVRPTMDERIMDYYERIKQRFEGGAPVESTTHLSYR